MRAEELRQIYSSWASCVCVCACVCACMCICPFPSIPVQSMCMHVHLPIPVHSRPVKSASFDGHAACTWVHVHMGGCIWVGAYGWVHMGACAYGWVNRRKGVCMEGGVCMAGGGVRWGACGAHAGHMRGACGARFTSPSSKTNPGGSSGEWQSSLCTMKHGVTVSIWPTGWTSVIGSEWTEFPSPERCSV